MPSYSSGPMGDLHVFDTFLKQWTDLSNAVGMQPSHRYSCGLSFFESSLVVFGGMQANGKRVLGKPCSSITETSLVSR